MKYALIFVRTSFDYYSKEVEASSKEEAEKMADGVELKDLVHDGGSDVVGDMEFVEAEEVEV